MRPVNITRTNYELFFVDYFDGKLTDEEVMQLMLFLDHNADLKEELALFNRTTLPSDAGSVRFDGKEGLKRSLSAKPKINELNFAEFCIAYHEKQLNPLQEEDLLDYVARHPEKKKDMELFGKVYLRSDYSVKYPGKRTLYKGKKTVLAPRYRWVAAAATVAVLITLYVLLPVKTGHTIHTIAKTNNPVPGKTLTGTDISGKEPDYVPSGLEIAKSEPYSSTPHRHLSVLPENRVAGNNGQNSMEEKTVEANGLAALNPVEINTLSPGGNSRLLPALRITPVKTASGNNTPEGDYLTIQELAAQQIEKKFGSKKESGQTGISFWDVAQAGINGIGKLTGSQMKMEKQYDKAGRLVAVAVNSKNFAIEAPVKKND